MSGDAIADLQRANAALQRQLDLCRADLLAMTADRDDGAAREAATAEILQVINASRGNLALVFDTILEKALHLFDAAFGLLLTYDGSQFYHVSSRGLSAAATDYLRAPLQATGSLGRLAAGEPLVQIADITDDDHYRSGSPTWRALADLSEARAALWLSLRSESALLGAFVVFRRAVHPFSDKEIALLRNFAAPAVIAIENTRLLTETREAFAQQTAVSEVLQVINSSPGELAPVFDAMLEKATVLCDAASGVLWVAEGERFRAVASLGFPPVFGEFLRTPLEGGPDTGIGRLRRGEQIAHIADLAAAPGYSAGDPLHRAAVDLGGIRSLLAVPLRKDGILLGAFGITRLEVRPFTDKQIALLQNFAAQAVIAMENARLLGELRQRTRDLEESLEYQTATSEVLQVISRSTFDVNAVLEFVCETAARLCKARAASIFLLDNDVYRWAAGVDVVPAYREIEEKEVIRPGSETLVGRVALSQEAVHILDALADPFYERKDDLHVGGFRTILGVPLMREGTAVGVICLGREVVEPYSDKQIQLVRTFADQAVIAIENTRLLTELRESLEQQQAMAEVLGVINANPGNLQPVFDAMLNNAARLCETVFGALFIYESDVFRVAAVHGPAPLVAFLSEHSTVRPGPGTMLVHHLSGEPVVERTDLAIDQHPGAGPRIRRAFLDLGGARSALSVALRSEGRLIGVIQVYRPEVRPFSERQIALLQSFAAQAVIAMDNARLLDEIRQRQAELHVTFDNMGDGVAMFDTDMRLAAWNRNFEQILGLPEELLAPRPNLADYVRYLATHGEYGEVNVEAEVRRLTEAAGRQWSTERARPDGRVIEVRVNPVPGGGVVLIYSDVTERKRAEAEIRSARDAAERALAELRATQQQLVVQQKMAALGQLTAGVAHEIKNPLNFVNNFAGLSIELLEELTAAAAPGIATLDDDTRAEIDETVEMLTSNLDKIAEHGRRADGIVKSMLEHSRGSSGDRRPVELNALVEEALNLAYHGARAQDQSFNITLERDLDPTLAPIELAPQDLTRVFLNLIGNGFYAATKKPGNRPVLKVATRELGDGVEVRVRDNGTGIASEVRDKLFQPFVTTKPTGEGTGLGLSISWDIVAQQHGGTIEVDSEPGAFTEFIVRLPRLPEAADGTAA